MRRYDIMGYVPRYWCEGSEWFSVYYLFVCIIHMKPLSLLVDTQHNPAVSVPILHPGDIYCTSSV